MPTLSPLPSRSSTANAGFSWMQALLAACSEASPTHNSLAENERQAARLALAAVGLPGKREEAWRFTDPSLLSRIAPRPMDPAAGSGADLPATADHTWRLHLDTWTMGPESSWPAGIEPLQGSELEAHFGGVLAATAMAQQWAIQLNSAIAPKVVALRIRPGSPRLELVSDAEQRSGVQGHRLLLLLEEGANLDLLQVHQASGPSLTSVVVEAQLDRNSTLRHGLVTRGTASSALMAAIAVSQAAGSHYAHTSVCSGWGLARQEPVVVQREGQASTQLRGLHWLRQHELADTHSRVHFGGPEGTLDQVHKVVAEDESHSVFNGCIQVPRQAQRTKASQLSRSLLLSDRARIDTKPELEIVADDVRCTHGATISRLQPDQLFYLQSRGIGASRASQLLLRSFCAEVLDQLPQGAEAWNPLASLLEEAS